MSSAPPPPPVSSAPPPPPEKTEISKVTVDIPSSNAAPPLPEISLIKAPSTLPATSSATTEVPWTTANINVRQQPIEDGRFETTLSWGYTQIASFTVQISPVTLLLVGDSTVLIGGPAITTDNLVLSLEPAGILYQLIPTATSAESTRQSSTPQTTEPISTASPSEPSPDTPSPGISSGAIAGIAIAGVLLIALVIGGWYFWRRKKRRTQPATATLTEDELVRREGDGDKIVLDQHQTAPTTGTYQTQYQEMSGNGLTQEPDRSHSYKYAIGGAHELRAEDKPGELPYAGVDNGRDGVVQETTATTGTDNAASQAAQVSPHVEAQRKREVEWLEMEEARMRQRREALLQQGGAET